MKRAFVVLGLAVGLSSAAQADLIVSEVVEGTAANFKYVEILNTSGVAVDFAVTLAELRRHTNGAIASTAIPLTGVIPANGFYVIANNVTDYQAVFGGSANASQYNSSINHNGDDSYDLFDGTSVVDAFASDWNTGVDPGNPAADGSYYREIGVYPNDGDWGGTAASPPADGASSPNGFWTRRLITASNGNAAAVCTPFAFSGSEVPVEVTDFTVE